MNCQKCGSLQVSTGIEITTLGDPERVYLMKCRNQWCGRTCRICHRGLGDVHGPKCGPVMFAKLDFPKTNVSREDF